MNVNSSELRSHLQRTFQLFVFVASSIVLVGCPKSRGEEATQETNQPQTRRSFVRGIGPGPSTTVVKTLQQNWSDLESVWFYRAPQGSRLLPYDWYLYLEQANSEDLFRSNDNIRRFGYLPRHPSDDNPDGLPVGFAKDAPYPGGVEGLGFTCAACHTGRIDVNLGDENVMFLIDGAPTLADLEEFQLELAAALRATVQDSDKFDRFAARLEVSGQSAKADLKAFLDDIASLRETYNRRNLPSTSAPEFGHGRVDAFGAIMNQVAVAFLNDESNHAPADAPVSYPFIWDAPQHDKVQWNGAAENNTNSVFGFFIGTDEIGALGRNTGEVLGVFGNADPSDERGFLGGYKATDNRSGLIDIENSLKTLWSPQWPNELGEIDTTKAAQGEQLFLQNCDGCHNNSAFNRDDPDRSIVARLKDVGTDQAMAFNYATRQANTGILEGRNSQLRHIVRGEKFGATAPLSELLAHMVIRSVIGPDSVDVFQSLNAPTYFIDYEPYVQVEVSGMTIVGPQDSLRDLTLKDFEIESQDFERFQQFRMEFESPSPDPQSKNQLEEMQELQIGGRLPTRRFEPNTSAPDVAIFTEEFRLQLAAAPVSYTYKARPLNGVWATAPFLHNGSVPNLWELLKSPTAANERDRRTTRFFVGSTEFDSVNVGFVSDRGPSEFDTSLPGNSNSGHTFGTNLSDEQKRQLIEYIKTL